MVTAVNSKLEWAFKMKNVEITVERGEAIKNLPQVVDVHLKSPAVKRAMSRAGVERIDTVAYDGSPEHSDGAGYTLSFSGKNTAGKTMTYPVYFKD